MVPNPVGLVSLREKRRLGPWHTEGTHREKTPICTWRTEAAEETGHPVCGTLSQEH